MPRVSVIIPSFNHESFIREAVDSVLNQTLEDLELIVVDDGSEDRTLTILNSYHDSRMRVISQSNQGAHTGINRGLNQAASQYLAILNSDDVYVPRRLEILINLLEGNSHLGLVGSYIEVIDGEGRSLGIKEGFRTLSPWKLEFPERSFRSGTNLKCALLTENFFSTTSNFVFPRKAFDRIGEFRKLRYAHDWDYALRMIQNADIELVQEPLVRYRVHERNTIREDQVAMIYEICWCLATHIPTSMRKDWFLAQPLDDQVDRLMHSIYAFDFERIITILLFLGISQDRELAERLLDQENPVRQKMLEYIRSQLDSDNQPIRATVPPSDEAAIDRKSHRQSKILAALRKVSKWLG